MSWNIAVVGGGAAGFFAAIHAAAYSPKTKVVIFEGSHKPLSKVLISGGGRCNVTNYTLDPRQLVLNYPRGSRELLGAFSRFAVSDTMQWFEKAGAELKVEADNRVFPTSDRSETIASCLRRVATERRIDISQRAKVKAIAAAENGFTLSLSNSSPISVDRVILATGGGRSGFDLARSLGHTIVSPVPSLFTFEIDHPLIEGFAGLSFENVDLSLSLSGRRFIRSGPLLITHWGLSGPAVIQLSALAARELFESNYSASLKISFLPNFKPGGISNIFEEERIRDARRRIASWFPLPIPKRFWSRALSLSGIQEDLQLANISNTQLTSLESILLNCSMTVSGKGVFKEEFVTCGGVNLKEVDFRTMESKVCPGVFFAGEILDIDGLTGGFNFQNAWTTGFIAGTNCVIKE